VSSRDGAASPEDAARRRRWTALADAAALYGIIAMGGVLGSLLRWAVALILLPFTGELLPWATLFANVTGCFAIGFYATLTGPDGRVFVGPRMRQFFTTGICGGYTTYSGFGLETVHLFLSGDERSAAIYVAISVVGWLAAVWLGDEVARRLNSMRGM
jgi:CrcB protein